MWRKSCVNRYFQTSSLSHPASLLLPLRPKLLDSKMFCLQLSYYCFEIYFDMNMINVSLHNFLLSMGKLERSQSIQEKLQMLLLRSREFFFLSWIYLLKVPKVVHKEIQQKVLFQKWTQSAAVEVPVVWSTGCNKAKRIHLLRTPRRRNSYKGKASSQTHTWRINFP